LRLREQYHLTFSAIDDFTASSFTERQTLYQSLCELIWDPANFGIEVPEGYERQPTDAPERRQRYYGVSLKDLLDSGLLSSGQALLGTRNGVTCAATVTSDGQVELGDGRREESPSTAGAAALGTRACNGWHFWQTVTPRGLVRLSRVRDDYLERQRR
jgi:hypothetical protein